MTPIRLTLTAFISLLTVAAAFAQESDFKIGPADVLSVTVLGAPDFTRELRVAANGTIRMPFIGEIKADGLSPVELETQLADLLDPDYVKDPQVSVIVKDPRSRTFSVIGAVIKPDQYLIVQPITLVAAIAGAGGLNFTKAGDVAYIDRNHGQVEVNLKKLLFEGDMSLDIQIKPGDVINIPVRPETFVYVIGDVTRPGPFDYSADKKITLSRALAMAGGPTRTSKLKKAALIRQKPDGSIDRSALDLGKVLRGQLPDVALQPNDMLYIPGSVEKNLGWTLLQQVPYMLTWMIIP